MISSARKRMNRHTNQRTQQSRLNIKYDEFTQIINDRKIESHYQPIISLQDTSVLGYEALTRGPLNSDFRSPVTLFSYAQKHGDTYKLEKMAREMAILSVKGLNTNQKLFINISAQIINDPTFTPGETQKILEVNKLSPQNVVFEITERSSIEDFTTVKKILEHYRSQGYKIAIDDAGAGYSSLQAIAELKPDYIKVDRSLIHRIHEDKIKENILETFVLFAQKMNSIIIAEGIEEYDELKKLLQLGVHYGQGYLLQHPQPEIRPIEKSLIQFIEEHQRTSTSSGVSAIGDLATPIKMFSKDTHVSEVYNYFKNNDHDMGAVIVSGQAPIGLIMREKLYQQLSEQYGVHLYWNRSIEKLMDRNPLVVESFIPVDQVSQLALSRENTSLYDFVIVEKSNQVIGVATIRDMVECITQEKMERARFSNPLTGLPGNTQIKLELNKRLNRNESFSVIYADLDYFKWFNDCFGFQKGDEMIQYTANLLHQVLFTKGHSEDFIGHIGGDDFIMLTSFDDPVQLCEEIIERFDKGVNSFYEGQVSSVKDRDGNFIDNDGVTLSLSLLICKNTTLLTIDQISQISTQLKKKAKSQRGSVYMLELIQ